VLYRIYIPALDKDGVSMTIDVEAENWMLALRYGLDEIGADRDIIKRAICDIKTDKSIHVMEPAEGHVFVLREVPAYDRPTAEELPAVDPTAATGEIQMMLEAPEDTVPESKGYQAPASLTADTSQVPQFIDSDEPAWASQVPEPEFNERPTAEVLQAVTQHHVTTSAPSMEQLDYPLNEADLEKYFDEPTTTPGRSISHLDLNQVDKDQLRVVGRDSGRIPGANIKERLKATERAHEELFAQVFEEMAEIDFVGDTVEEALTYSLELAVKRIPSEAGWLLLADMNRRDLYFATATGPKAEEVINYRLPMGKGLAGFCAVNGVSLSLSDVENDPRFQSSISKSVGYRIDSVACSPVQYEGRVFGALQIMNHREGSEYTPGELDVLNYIAKRTAEYLSQHIEM